MIQSNHWKSLGQSLCVINRVDKLGPYNSPWAINNRGKVPELSNFNPRWPDRNPAYLTGVFIHRANNNGWAGEFKKMAHGMAFQKDVFLFIQAIGGSLTNNLRVCRTII